MSKRVLISSLVAVAAVGGITAGGLAIASAATELTVEKGSAHYAAPAGGKDGKFTFTADVSDNSGVVGLKVLAWPASSKPDPTEAEMRSVESAKCERISDETSRCTYTPKVTEAEAADLAEGTWHVSVLATAKDGDKKFVPSAATFDIKR
ncbi:DUF5707 domain-containing protein [Streptomyces sp. NPDC019531]|uniref:DUF5707 domain-containing protein n=1 Tax=Streptomyces sp. NPDC019531 TaxID=3365062 RepID=UPI003850DE47